MSFVEILKVTVLGIVEGFTEWLPISVGTGHMILVDGDHPSGCQRGVRGSVCVVIQLAILRLAVLYFNKMNRFHRTNRWRRSAVQSVCG